MHFYWLLQLTLTLTMTTQHTTTAKSKSRDDYVMVKCAECETPNKMRRNTTSCRCRAVVYCNNKCKKNNWQEHAISCPFTQEKMHRIEIYNSAKTHTSGVELLCAHMLESQLHNVDILEELEEAQNSNTRKDFFYIVEQISRKAALHHHDRTYPKLQLLDSFNFSYPYYEDDIRMLEQSFANVNTVKFMSLLKLCALKQNVHIERIDPELINQRKAAHAMATHLRTIELAERLRRYEEADEHTTGVDIVLARIVPCLQYPKYAEDIKIAEMSCGKKDFFETIERMNRKQALHKGDRSYRTLELIDSHTFTYPDATKDMLRIEKYFASLLLSGEDEIAKSERKQQVFCGDRSHSQIVSLDDFMTHASYPSKELDFQKAMR